MAPLVWLVTGCSSGFGETFVESILAKGDQVIATARGDASTRLARLAKLGAATLELDVTAPQADLDACVATAVNIYGRIDVLVNNAGYVDGGFLEENGQDHWVRAFMANVIGPLNLTRSVLAHMRPRRSGTILFQGSVTIYQALPGCEVYAAGKAALDTATHHLGVELAPFNIRICTLVTGYFRTEVMRPGNFTMSRAKPIAEYDELFETTRTTINGMHGKQMGDPRKASDIVIDAVHGDGICEGLELPSHLPLGPDGIALVRGGCQARLDLCDRWEKIVSSTNFDTEVKATEDAANAAS